MRSYLSRLAGVARTVFGNPGLLRVELAFVGFNIAEWATWVSILAFAYQVGGASATGLVAVVQLVPAALVAPLASVTGDRFRRELVLLAGYLAQAVAMAATAAALLAGAPVPLIYGLAALAATSITITRPAQNALLPMLARTPDELTAANVASGWTESVSVLVGPAVAALLLGLYGSGAVFAVMAGLVAGSAVLVVRVRPGAEPDQPAAMALVLVGRARRPGDLVRSALEGFTTLARERLPRLSVGLLSIQYVVLGALDVLLVVLAFEVLDIGSSGVGLLNSALGTGAILGAALMVLLVGRRLAVPITIGFACWGLAMGTIGLIPVQLAVPALVALAGVGSALTEIAGRLLLQRSAPTRPSAGSSACSKA
jgi:MFS family permease